MLFDILAICILGGVMLALYIAATYDSGETYSEYSERTTVIRRYPDGRIEKRYDQEDEWF